MPAKTKNTPATPGRFGPFGGQYVPEVLMGALPQFRGECARTRFTLLAPQ